MERGSQLSAKDSEVLVLASFLDHPDIVGERICQCLRSEHFSDTATRNLFEVLSRLFSKGESIDPVKVLRESKKIEMEVPADLIGDLIGSGSVDIEWHIHEIIRVSNSNELLSFLWKSIDYIGRKEPEDGGKLIVDRLIYRATGIFENNATPDDKNGVLRTLLKQADDKQAPGINLPWPKLQARCGPVVAHEIVGISGYSGNGKSQFLANLFFYFCTTNQPVIVFSTEMGKQWVKRVAALAAGVSQTWAEKGNWQDPAELQRYKNMLTVMKNWPYEIITQGRITLDQVISRSKILRKQWPGRPVAVLIDHMHRLDYGNYLPDKVVGKATQEIKDVAKEDDEGLIFFMAFQPRKPDEDKRLFRPLLYHQIRGASSVGNEIDIHMSPFRTWVEKNDLKQTVYKDGKPKIVPPPSDLLPSKSASLDDQHTYLRLDKRRIGGDGGTLFFRFDSYCGRIFEHAFDEKVIYDGNGNPITSEGKE